MCAILTKAVLFDRDGTLVVNVPYNGDPERVVPMPGARVALDRLREAGLLLGVVTNQSAVGRGYITMHQMWAVNTRIEAILGPMGYWSICPHAPEEACACRKPSPGLILEAARHLKVLPSECVMVGDVGADVQAALAAGARGILVPTPSTRPEDVGAATSAARSRPADD